MDFFTVPTLTFRVRCCLFIRGHEIQPGFRPVARILQVFWESIAQQKMPERLFYLGRCLEPRRLLKRFRVFDHRQAEVIEQEFVLRPFLR